MIIPDSDAIETLAKLMRAAKEMYDEAVPADRRIWTPHALGYVTGLFYRRLTDAQIAQATKIAKGEEEVR